MRACLGASRPSYAAWRPRRRPSLPKRHRVCCPQRRRPNDPIDEVKHAWEARVRCHRCEKSYVAHEMDRDPSGDHAAICAACATGPAFHAAAREESLAYRRVARQPSQVA